MGFSEAGSGKTEVRSAGALNAGVLIAALLAPACGGDGNTAGAGPSGGATAADAPRSAPLSAEARRIDEALESGLTGPGELKNGLAAAILIDVSGSMNRAVGGRASAKKIDIARRAATDLVEEFARYADDHPLEPVLLAIYEFSRRDDVDDARVVVPMGRPDRARARQGIAAMRADGGTPISTSMIEAKRALDATGVSKRHLLVITDGENTNGFEPEDVTAAIGRRPVEERPSIYFVAFDIEASRFTTVRDAGGLVLAAANAAELKDTLDSLIRGRILVERD